MQAIEQWLAMMREALTHNYGRLDQVLADMQSSTKGREPK